MIRFNLFFLLLLAQHAPAPARRWRDLVRAAEYGDYSVRQLRDFIRTGKLPAYRVGGRGNIKIDLNDIDALIEGAGPVQTLSDVPTERERQSGRFVRSA